MGSRRFTHRIIAIAFTALIFLAHSPFAWAEEKIKELSEDNVKAFIENTTDITTGNSQDLSSAKIVEYLDKHIEDQARFKSVMKYHMPDLPVQEATLSLKKDEFMQSVSEGAESVEGYENLIEINEIKIASNKKKAFVKTTSTEYATMDVPTETGYTEEVPMEGISECTQSISLNRGVIQMFSAQCVTDINFLEY